MSHFNVWFTANVLPLPCYFCEEPIYVRGERGGASLVIHHVDHDHMNNVPENLVAAHRSCHISYHHRGVPLSDATRAAIAETMRATPKPEGFIRQQGVLSDAWRRQQQPGWFHTEEARDKIAAANQERTYGPMSDDQRQKISKTLTGRKTGPRSEETRARISASRRGKATVRSVCSGCGREYNSIWMTRHRKEGRCV